MGEHAKRELQSEKEREQRGERARDVSGEPAPEIAATGRAKRGGVETERPRDSEQDGPSDRDKRDAEQRCAPRP
jgi:hypothetical protein